MQCGLVVIFLVSINVLIISNFVHKRRNLPNYVFISTHNLFCKHQHVSVKIASVKAEVGKRGKKFKYEREDI